MGLAEDHDRLYKILVGARAAHGRRDYHTLCWSALKLLHVLTEIYRDNAQEFPSFDPSQEADLDRSSSC